MDRVLVVGAGGFLARHLVRCLADSGEWELITVGRAAEAGVDGAIHHSLDCGDLAGIREVIRTESPDRIVCLAGSSGPDFAEMLRFNVEVPGAVLAEAAALVKKQPVRVVLAGSAAEFGAPEILPVTESSTLAPRSDYGLTKSLQTRIAEYRNRISKDRVRVTVAHLFNLIGPGSPARLVFGSFVEQITRGVEQGVLKTGNLETERDFIHVIDAAEALAAILKLAQPDSSYIVASGRPVRIRALLDHLIQISNREVSVETDPARHTAFDVPCIYGDSSRLTAASGWAARRSAESALEEMWRERG